MPDKYLYTGHPGESLASGRAPTPHEEIPDDALTRDADRNLDPHDQALIDEGKLLPIVTDSAELSGDALKQRARDLNIEGRSDMNADQLRAAIAEAEKETSQ